jgi:peptidoglycan/xylan/chitin deacetylase (PgdA/CDA1 family)
MTAELSTPPARRPVPQVLMYHSVGWYLDDPFQVTVNPYRFERQMRWLKERGLRGVSMAELDAARGTGRAHGMVGLTFDDGYADFVSHVLPVLAQYTFGATVFVIAGKLGGENTWDQPGPRKALMTDDQVRAVAAAGIEIGSHGRTHLRLTTVTGDVLRDEVRMSRDILADTLGYEVDGFCYPYGAAGSREVAAVRAAGYRYGCGVEKSTLDLQWAMPRTFIGERDTSWRLYAKRIRHRFVHNGGTAPVRDTTLPHSVRPDAGSAS